MAVYKYGSKRQAFDNIHLAVPTIEWIGILPEDIERLHIPESALSPMSKKDLQKCESLKTRPYFRHDESLLAEIDLLIEMKKKAEIQCLDAISSNYLCDVYLPSRLSLVMT
uniref:Topoisomerase 6 subunit A/Spo11 TOPRIM domain-containing protein n=1 Tax=Arion vulgaris TaxID=1028688 RepID=A0A0B6Z9I8_9EUPU